MDSKIHSENLVVLLDRMSPEARERLIERFCEQRGPALDRLVQLTVLRAKLAKNKLKT